MDISKVLKGVGLVAGAFNPVVGGVISAVAGALNEINDESLENEKGLGYVAYSLRKMVERDEFDKEKLLELSKIVDDAVMILDKNFKLIK